jgi:uncharacterized protein YprB with RNaseH-like and TPR domain
MKNLLLILTTILIAASRCGNEEPLEGFPNNIEEAVAHLEKGWSKSEKKLFKEQNERKAVASLHMSTGLWIRNNWIRNDEDTSLVFSITSLGVGHPDDMSSIILTSFHRKLNSKAFDIKDQIERIKEYWEPIISCDIKKVLRGEEIYSTYKVGDTIAMLMPVRSKNAVVHGCPTFDWDFDSTKDLRIKGIVTEKYNIGSESNVFFNIKLTGLSRYDIKILMVEVEVGSTIKMQPKNITLEN